MRALPRWALKQARQLLLAAGEHGPHPELIAEIDKCLSPSSSTKSHRVIKARKRAAKNATTAEIHAAIDARNVDGRCECGCGQMLFVGMNEMDHFWGRGKTTQTAENCWQLCREHHRHKTDNYPSALAWAEKYRAHCIRHSFWAEAAKAGKRIEYLRAKAALSKRTAP